MAVSQSLSVTEVSGSVNTTANTSKVRILWTSTQTGDSHNDYTRTAKYYVSINGGAETEYSVSYTLPQNSTKTIVDTTITVNHRNDGSGTVSVRTWMDTGISAGVVQKSKNLSLTTIPRASTITAAYEVTLGSRCKLIWTPASASFHYKVRFAIGSWSYTTEAFCPGITSAYTYTGYHIPYEVAEQFPSSTNGVMTATLYTYSDSGTTQVGSASSGAFAVIVPDNETTKPSVKMTLSPDTPYEKFSSLYLQGISKVKATFEGKGKYDASITAYSLQAEGKRYTEEPFTSNILAQSGEATIVGFVSDSRGFSNSVEEDITVIAYSKPSLLPVSGENKIICARCDSLGNLTESGKHLKIKAMRRYSPVISDGVQKNYCTIRYRYVTEGNKFSGDEGWTTLLAGSTSSTDTVDKTLSEVTLSTSTSYIVQIGVIDDVGYSHVIQFVIPTDFVTLDVPESSKGRRVGLFRYAQDAEDDGLYLGLPLFGGSVDSLKLGTPLLATEAAPISLNDVKIPGCYYSSDKDTTKYISDTPSDVDFGFGLEVREMQSKDNLRQTLYYGITTWCRHSNGAEWSAWVSTLRGTSADVIASDFVIDSGVSGLWNYRLWQSGEAELWGRITLDTYGDARHIYSVVGLPFPFAAKPTVIMTLSEAVAYSYRQGQILLSEVYVVGASAMTLYMIKNEGGLVSGNTADVSVNIKGNWK